MCKSNDLSLGNQYFDSSLFSIHFRQLQYIFSHSALKPSCDNVTISDFKKNDISGRWLRLHRISAIAHSGIDSLPLCFGQLPTSYIKINCLKFSKTVWCNKNKKTNSLYAEIHHHVLQWFSPFILTAKL